MLSRAGDGKWKSGTPAQMSDLRPGMRTGGPKRVRSVASPMKAATGIHFLARRLSSPTHNWRTPVRSSPACKSDSDLGKNAKTTQVPTSVLPEIHADPGYGP